MDLTKSKELIAAVTELALQHELKKKRAAELVLTNQELSDFKYALDESSIVSITDRKGHIKHVNDNFCKISGYERSELIGQDHRILNSGYHSKEFIRLLWIKISAGKIWRGEIKNKDKQGNFFWMDTTIVPFLNVEGSPYQYVAIRTDITERKVWEETRTQNDLLELRVKERTEELESFTYSVSHDLRAPLRAVSGYAKMLQENYQDAMDSEGKRLLSEVRNYAKKMGMLIDDLLSFSRLSKNVIRESVIDMNSLVNNCIQEVNQSYPHHATFDVLHMQSVTADYELIKQVILNLFFNAVKYSSKVEHPRIVVKSIVEGGEIVYSVSDNGAGFDMEYYNKLFGVFQRLHSEDEFEGNGVGLAIVQRIIRKHGGRVWADSKVNEGATFYFSMPQKLINLTVSQN